MFVTGLIRLKIVAPASVETLLTNLYDKYGNYFVYSYLSNHLLDCQVDRKWKTTCAPCPLSAQTDACEWHSITARAGSLLRRSATHSETSKTSRNDEPDWFLYSNRPISLISHQHQRSRITCRLHRYSHGTNDFETTGMSWFRTEHLRNRSVALATCTGHVRFLEKTKSKVHLFVSMETAVVKR